MKELSLSHLGALVLSLLLWGTTFPALKGILSMPGNPPLALFFYRYFDSTVILVIVVLIMKRGRSLRCPFRYYLLGILNFFAMAFQMEGLVLTTATKGAVLSQMVMVVVPFLSFLLLGENFSLRKLLAVFGALSGAVMISTNLDFSGLLVRNSFQGDLLVSASVLFWSLYIVLTRKWASHADPISLLWASQIPTVLLAFPACLLTGQVHLTRQGHGAALFLGLICSLATTVLYNYSLRRIDATTSTILGPIELITALLISLFVLGEGFTLVETAGSMIALCAALFAVVPSPARFLPRPRKFW